MNREMVDKIARAVLYEGYILYPYRPSVKNRQRWTFGGLYPEAYSRAQDGTDACAMQTECLVLGGAGVKLDVTVRCLHLLDRTVGELAGPLAELPREGEPAFREVQSLRVGERLLQAWQEAEEREVALGEFDVAELAAKPLGRPFAFGGRREIEPVRPEAGGAIVAVLVREQQLVEGSVELSAVRLADDAHRVTVRILNRTAFDDAALRSRDEALMRSLVSTHTILGVRGGAFVSLTDPPAAWRAAAKACRNVGAWPVLVGTGAERDTMLSSPIILADYPEIAPESPGDLFDSTEIDEILTLRIMTLTDEEKRAAAGVDERARALLARTESLAREQLMGLHGTVRGLRPVPVAPQPQEQRHG